MNEQELLKRIGELPREIEPGRDPWDRIATRLDEASTAPADRAGVVQPRSWAGPLRAVAALAVFGLAVVLMSGPGSVVDRPADEQVSAYGAAHGVLPVTLAGSEAEYQAAFREFIALGDSRERIPSLTVEKIETGWADLRQVESALADALAQNPGDPFLNRRMLQLRERQLGFLRQLATLDNSNRRLTI